MPRGQNQPEKYEIDNSENFYVRCHCILRQIYYLYRDAELTGEVDHESLKMFVDSIIYNALVAEEKIKETSKNVPTEHPPVHGNERMNTERMIENMNRFYESMRKRAHERTAYKKVGYKVKVRR